jgi:heme/copper-type cytochrome/quinol oxidase subunit 4
MSWRTVKRSYREVTLSHQHFQNVPANQRRTGIVLFYLSAILSVIAISLIRRTLSFRTPLLVMAFAGAAVAILFLWRFLRSNDEHERQINYRALTFAFIGTLVFSAAIGFLQSLGFHSVSWLGIPALMVILWSIGLIVYSWRYR